MTFGTGLPSASSRHTHFRHNGFAPRVTAELWQRGVEHCMVHPIYPLPLTLTGNGSYDLLDACRAQAFRTVIYECRYPIADSHIVRSKIGTLTIDDQPSITIYLSPDDRRFNLSRDRWSEFDIPCDAPSRFAVKSY